MYFSLKLFGGACLQGEDGPATGPAAQRHRLALLALLSLAQPDGVSRDKLIAFLWPERDGEHARGLLKQGRRDDARRMLAQLRGEGDRTGFHRPQVATVFLALDDVDGALQWLERSYQERIPELGARALAVLNDPLLARLQDEPRFHDLRRRIGLPD